MNYRDLFSYSRGEHLEYFDRLIDALGCENIATISVESLGSWGIEDIEVWEVSIEYSPGWKDIYKPGYTDFDDVRKRVWVTYCVYKDSVQIGRGEKIYTSPEEAANLIKSKLKKEA